MKINGIDTSKGGTTNAFIEWLWYRGYDIVKAEAPNANFECYEATITDKSGYNKVTVFFGGCDSCHITARIDKINGTHKWYYGKTLGQIEAVVRQCMEGYTFEEHTEEPAADADENKEEDTMNTTTETIELKAPVTFERKGNLSPVTLVKAEKRWYDHQWHFVDTDNTEWYQNPNWDNDEHLMAFYMMDSSRGQEIQISTDTYEALINNDWETTTTENEKEETTMKSTNTKIDLNNATATFTLFDGTTYTYHIESRRYSKTEGGKTKRIGKAEYESAKHEYEAANELASMAEQEQAELDKDPCRVEVNSDLYKPAVLDKVGCVDCSNCNVNGCVHRNCMRRNPRKVGGLGECPRLDAEPDGAQDSELEQIMEETGLEPADAELERNVRNGQKKPSKPRRSKDIAYEGNGVTLTAKQVDFLRELQKTEAFKEDENDMVIEDITITIGGQFEDKPMTVGAMISTLCEKHLGTRIKAKVGNRTMTLFGLTPSGKDIMDAIK